MVAFKVVVDTLAQPKVVAIVGVLVLVVGGFQNNESACISGLIILFVALIWGMFNSRP